MSDRTPGSRTAAGFLPFRRPGMSSPTANLPTGRRRERTIHRVAPWITDSVLPIVAARREVVKSDHQFCDIVKLLPTPGHTIDHYSDQFGKPGADTVITGGKIHSPLQARFPELGMRVDYSFPQAGKSHRQAFRFPLRHGHAGLYRALPVAVLRPDEALGRRPQVRIGVGVVRPRQVPQHHPTPSARRFRVASLSAMLG